MQERRIILVKKVFKKDVDSRWSLVQQNIYVVHLYLHFICLICIVIETNSIECKERIQTFWPFDEFHFGDFLSDGFTAQDVESDDGPRFLESLHGLTVCHLPNINIIHEQNAVIYSEKQRERKLWRREISGEFRNVRSCLATNLNVVKQLCRKIKTVNIKVLNSTFVVCGSITTPNLFGP